MKTIYIIHSKGFDFQKELYEPLKKSPLSKQYTLVFPHELGKKQVNSKEFIKKTCDVILAEVSYPATGMGIELGWADAFQKPIIGVYKKDSQLSTSVKMIIPTLVEYTSKEDLVAKITQAVIKLK